MLGPVLGKYFAKLYRRCNCMTKDEYDADCYQVERRGQLMEVVESIQISSTDSEVDYNIYRFISIFCHSGTLMQFQFTPAFNVPFPADSGLLNMVLVSTTWLSGVGAVGAPLLPCSTLLSEIFNTCIWKIAKTTRSIVSHVQALAHIRDYILTWKLPGSNLKSKSFRAINFFCGTISSGLPLARRWSVEFKLLTKIGL